VDQDTILLKNYLSGHMDATEKAAFELRLVKEPDLAIAMGQLKNSIIHDDDEIADETEEQASEDFSYSKWWPIVAIVLLIGTYFGWAYISKTSRHYNTEKSFSELLNQLPADSLSNSNVDKTWKEAFAKHDYEAVIASLKENSSRSAIQNYYLALSYSAHNRDRKARAILETDQLKSGMFAQNSAWLNALIYAKNRQPEKAKELFQQIAESQSPFATQAKAMLAQ
jgi:hypothetical protein